MANITMGVVVDIPRCNHCEWDDFLLFDTPAENGLRRLRGMYAEGSLDHEQFIEKEIQLLLDALGMESPGEVPTSVHEEMTRHLDTLKSQSDAVLDDLTGRLRFIGSSLPSGIITTKQLITGYDHTTGTLTIKVDLNKIIGLFEAEAPGPFTAMWLRLEKIQSLRGVKTEFDKWMEEAFKFDND